MQRWSWNHPKSFQGFQRIHWESPIDPGILPAPVEPLQLQTELNFFTTLREKQLTGRGIQAIKILLWEKKGSQLGHFKSDVKGCVLYSENAVRLVHTHTWLNENKVLDHLYPPVIFSAPKSRCLGVFTLFLILQQKQNTEETSKSQIDF
ncbi:hypothetical protein Nmel_013253 [Mimus melanotis]